MRLELTPFRIHSPALWPVELQPPSKTSRQQRRMQEDDGRNRTCVSGGCSSAPLPLGHVVVGHQHAGQGSNLSLPDLEAGAPPLGLPAREVDMRREGFEPPFATGAARVTAWCIAALPPARIFNAVSVEGFEPSTPCARGRCANQGALHAERKRPRTLPERIELSLAG